MLQDHEKRIRVLEYKKYTKLIGKSKTWYRSGSTIEKLVILIEEGFFDKPREMGDIISEFKTKDYHLKAPDLTLPLRKIVHKELLSVVILSFLFQKIQRDEDFAQNDGD